MRCGVLLKKQKNLTELEYIEGELGDAWIWIAFDPVNKVVVAFTVGKRKLPKAKKLLHMVRARFPENIPYFTSDELEHYTSAILEEYGIEKIFPRTGKRGRPRKPVKEIHPSLVYAQVYKHREKGRVKKIETNVIFGTEDQVKAKLTQSPVSNSVNTSLVERNNLTLRQQNGRFQRKTLQFSKEKELLYSQLHLFLGYYHFIRPHKSLRVRCNTKKRRWLERTPLMAAGITDHVWTFREFFFHKINLNKRGEFK